MVELDGGAKVRFQHFHSGALLTALDRIMPDWISGLNGKRLGRLAFCADGVSRRLGHAAMVFVVEILKFGPG
jgi:hypothetical protein